MFLAEICLQWQGSVKPTNVPKISCMQIKFCLSTVFTGTTIIHYIQLPSSFDLVRKCWEKKCFSKVHCIINSYGISQVSELLNLYNRINIYLKTWIHVVQFKKS